MIPEDKRNAWRYHPVVAGDTLTRWPVNTMSRQSELARANQLSTDVSLSGVEALVVPQAAAG